MNRPAIWSNIAVLTRKATLLVFSALLPCIFGTVWIAGGAGGTILSSAELY